jgi:5-enolpyruvylshikimate-3-phosphate synthase
MSLVILSTLLKETKFENIKCINKSYPKFFEDLFSLNIKGEYYED